VKEGHGIFERLRSSFAAAETDSEENEEEEPPPPYRVEDTKTKEIYIRKVELLLNGIPLDQVKLAFNLGPCPLLLGLCCL